MYNPSTQEVVTGGSGGQVHPQLPSKFEASLGYMKACLEGTGEEENEKEWG